MDLSCYEHLMKILELEQQLAAPSKALMRGDNCVAGVSNDIKAQSWQPAVRSEPQLSSNCSEPLVRPHSSHKALKDIICQVLASIISCCKDTSCAAAILPNSAR